MEGHQGAGATAPEPARFQGYLRRRFGPVQIKIHPAHEGRNPVTGKPMPIPARRRPFFKAGKELRELVNEAPRPASGDPAPGRSGG